MASSSASPSTAATVDMLRFLKEECYLNGDAKISRLLEAYSASYACNNATTGDCGDRRDAVEDDADECEDDEYYLSRRDAPILRSMPLLPSLLPDTILTTNAEVKRFAKQRRQAKKQQRLSRRSLRAESTMNNKIRKHQTAPHQTSSSSSASDDGGTHDESDEEDSNDDDDEGDAAAQLKTTSYTRGRLFTVEHAKAGKRERDGSNNASRNKRGIEEGENEDEERGGGDSSNRRKNKSAMPSKCFWFPPLKKQTNYSPRCVDKPTRAVISLTNTLLHRIPFLHSSTAASLASSASCFQIPPTALSINPLQVFAVIRRCAQVTMGCAAAEVRLLERRAGGGVGGWGVGKQMRAANNKNMNTTNKSNGAAPLRPSSSSSSPSTLVSSTKANFPQGDADVDVDVDAGGLAVSSPSSHHALYAFAQSHIISTDNRTFICEVLFSLLARLAASSSLLQKKKKAADAEEETCQASTSIVHQILSRVLLDDVYLCHSSSSSSEGGASVKDNTLPPPPSPSSVLQSTLIYMLTRGLGLALEEEEEKEKDREDCEGGGRGEDSVESVTEKGVEDLQTRRGTTACDAFMNFLKRLRSEQCSSSSSSSPPTSFVSSSTFSAWSEQLLSLLGDESPSSSFDRHSATSTAGGDDGMPGVVQQTCDISASPSPSPSPSPSSPSPFAHAERLDALLTSTALEAQRVNGENRRRKRRDEKNAKDNTTDPPTNSNLDKESAENRAVTPPPPPPCAPSPSAALSSSSSSSSRIVIATTVLKSRSASILGGPGVGAVSSSQSNNNSHQQKQPPTLFPFNKPASAAAGGGEGTAAPKLVVDVPSVLNILRYALFVRLKLLLTDVWLATVDESLRQSEAAAAAQLTAVIRQIGSVGSTQHSTHNAATYSDGIPSDRCASATVLSSETMPPFKRVGGGVHLPPEAACFPSFLLGTDATTADVSLTSFSMTEGDNRDGLALSSSSSSSSPPSPILLSPAFVATISSPTRSQLFLLRCWMHLSFLGGARASSSSSSSFLVRQLVVPVLQLILMEHSPLKDALKTVEGSAEWCKEGGGKGERVGSSSVGMILSSILARQGSYRKKGVSSSPSSLSNTPTPPTLSAIDAAHKALAERVRLGQQAATEAIPRASDRPTDALHLAAFIGGLGHGIVSAMEEAEEVTAEIEAKSAAAVQSMNKTDEQCQFPSNSTFSSMLSREKFTTKVTNNLSLSPPFLSHETRFLLCEVLGIAAIALLQLSGEEGEEGSSCISSSSNAPSFILVSIAVAVLEEGCESPIGSVGAQATALLPLFLLLKGDFLASLEEERRKEKEKGDVTEKKGSLLLSPSNADASATASVLLCRRAATLSEHLKRFSGIGIAAMVKEGSSVVVVVAVDATAAAGDCHRGDATTSECSQSSPSFASTKAPPSHSSSLPLPFTLHHLFLSCLPFLHCPELVTSLVTYLPPTSLEDTTSNMRDHNSTSPPSALLLTMNAARTDYLALKGWDGATLVGGGGGGDGEEKDPSSSSRQSAWPSSSSAAPSSADYAEGNGKKAAAGNSTPFSSDLTALIEGLGSIAEDAASRCCTTSTSRQVPLFSSSSSPRPAGYSPRSSTASTTSSGGGGGAVQLIIVCSRCALPLVNVRGGGNAAHSHKGPTSPVMGLVNDFAPPTPPPYVFAKIAARWTARHLFGGGGGGMSCLLPRSSESESHDPNGSNQHDHHHLHDHKEPLSSMGALALKALFRRWGELGSLLTYRGYYHNPNHHPHSSATRTLIGKSSSAGAGGGCGSAALPPPSFAMPDSQLGKPLFLVRGGDADLTNSASPPLPAAVIKCLSAIVDGTPQQKASSAAAPPYSPRLTSEIVNSSACCALIASLQGGGFSGAYALDGVTTAASHNSTSGGGLGGGGGACIRLWASLAPTEFLLFLLQPAANSVRMRSSAAGARLVSGNKEVNSATATAAHPPICLFFDGGVGGGKSSPSLKALLKMQHALLTTAGVKAPSSSSVVRLPPLPLLTLLPLQPLTTFWVSLAAMRSRGHTVLLESRRRRSDWGAETNGGGGGGGKESSAVGAEERDGGISAAAADLPRAIAKLSGGNAITMLRLCVEKLTQMLQPASGRHQGVSISGAPTYSSSSSSTVYDLLSFFLNAWPISVLEKSIYFTPPPPPPPPPPPAQRDSTAHASPSTSNDRGGSRHHDEDADAAESLRVFAHISSVAACLELLAKASAQLANGVVRMGVGEDGGDGGEAAGGGDGGAVIPIPLRIVCDALHTSADKSLRLIQSTVLKEAALDAARTISAAKAAASRRNVATLATSGIKSISSDTRASAAGSVTNNKNSFRRTYSARRAPSAASSSGTSTPPPQLSASRPATSSTCPSGNADADEDVCDKPKGDDVAADDGISMMMMMPRRPHTSFIAPRAPPLGDGTTTTTASSSSALASKKNLSVRRASSSSIATSFVPMGAKASSLADRPRTTMAMSARAASSSSAQQASLGRGGGRVGFSSGSHSARAVSSSSSSQLRGRGTVGIGAAAGSNTTANTKMMKDASRKEAFIADEGGGNNTPSNNCDDAVETNACDVSHMPHASSVNTSLVVDEDDDGRGVLMPKSDRIASASTRTAASEVSRLRPRPSSPAATTAPPQLKPASRPPSALSAGPQRVASGAAASSLTLAASAAVGGGGGSFRQRLGEALTSAQTIINKKKRRNSLGEEEKGIAVNKKKDATTWVYDDGAGAGEGLDELLGDFVIEEDTDGEHEEGGDDELAFTSSEASKAKPTHTVSASSSSFLAKEGTPARPSSSLSTAVPTAALPPFSRPSTAVGPSRDAINASLLRSSMASAMGGGRGRGGDAINVSGIDTTANNTSTGLARRGSTPARSSSRLSSFRGDSPFSSSATAMPTRRRSSTPTSRFDSSKHNADLSEGGGGGGGGSFLRSSTPISGEKEMVKKFAFGSTYFVEKE